MWHHILPGWVIVFLCDAVILAIAAESGNLTSWVIAAGLSMVAAGLLLFYKKRGKVFRALPAAVSGLLLLSGILLLLSCRWQPNAVILVFGVLDVIFTGPYFLVACILQKKK